MAAWEVIYVMLLQRLGWKQVGNQGEKCQLCRWIDKNTELIDPNFPREETTVRGVRVDSAGMTGFWSSFNSFNYDA